MSMATFVSRGLIAGRMSSWVRRGFAAYVPLAEPPPADKQYITADVSGGIPALSLANGADPPIATGDVWVIPLVTDRGATIVFRVDGGFSIDAGGDLSRQYFQYDVLDASLNAFYGLADAYVNDHAPNFSEAVYALARGATITPIDLRLLFTDPEGEAVTVRTNAVLPGTLAIADSLTGATSDENRIDIVDIIGSDVADNEVTGQITLITGQVQVPGTSGFDTDAAESLIVSGYLNYAIGAARFGSVAAGLIDGSDPAPGEWADPFSTVTLFPSLGIITPVLNSQALPIRRVKRNTDREEQDAEDRERLRTEVLQAAAAERQAAAMRAEAEANAAKQIRVQTRLPNKFRGRR